MKKKRGEGVDVFGAFSALFGDIAEEDSFPEKRPLLAHYISIPTIETILRHDELWLSNPLYMNNIEELRFGLIEGR